MAPYGLHAMVELTDIHGYVCQDCGRTHCAEARHCRCHEPGCNGFVTDLVTALDDTVRVELTENGFPEKVVQ